MTVMIIVSFMVLFTLTIPFLTFGSSFVCIKKIRQCIKGETILSRFFSGSFEVIAAFIFAASACMVYALILSTVLAFSKADISAITDFLRNGTFSPAVSAFFGGILLLDFISLIVGRKAVDAVVKKAVDEQMSSGVDKKTLLNNIVRCPFSKNYRKKLLHDTINKYGIDIDSV